MFLSGKITDFRNERYYFTIPDFPPDSAVHCRHSSIVIDSSTSSHHQNPGYRVLMHPITTCLVQWVVHVFCQDK